MVYWYVAIFVSEIRLGFFCVFLENQNTVSRIKKCPKLYQKKFQRDFNSECIANIFIIANGILKSLDVTVTCDCFSSPRFGYQYRNVVCCSMCHHNLQLFILYKGRKCIVGHFIHKCYRFYTRFLFCAN